MTEAAYFSLTSEYHRCSHFACARRNDVDSIFDESERKEVLQGNTWLDGGKQHTPANGAQQHVQNDEAQSRQQEMRDDPES